MYCLSRPVRGHDHFLPFVHFVSVGARAASNDDVKLLAIVDDEPQTDDVVVPQAHDSYRIELLLFHATFLVAFDHGWRISWHRRECSL
jgi:hypothetical protein